MAEPEPLPPLSEAQMEIMNVVWDRVEVTAADVWKALASRRKLARNSVLTSEIEVSRGDPGSLDLPPSLYGLDRSHKPGLDTTRTKGHVMKDKIRGNVEGNRFFVPPELRAGFQAYRTALSRSTPQAP